LQGFKTNRKGFFMSLAGQKRDLANLEQTSHQKNGKIHHLPKIHSQQNSCGLEPLELRPKQNKTVRQTLGLDYI
jgi:hypothetical protein